MYVCSGARVTCEVDYLCANFNLPRPLCSRVKPDVRDRQTTDVGRGGRRHNNRSKLILQSYCLLSCKAETRRFNRKSNV